MHVSVAAMHQNKIFCLKIVPNSSQSTVTYMSRKHNCVIELLQSYGYIYVQTMMIVAAVICKMELNSIVNIG